jgi:hypothetical protein
MKLLRNVGSISYVVLGLFEAMGEGPFSGRDACKFTLSNVAALADVGEFRIRRSMPEPKSMTEP